MLTMLYNIILPESSMLFHSDMWLCDCDWYITAWHNPNPKFQDIKKNKMKVNKVHCFQFWQVLDWSILAFQIWCVHALQDWSQITLLLVNIGLGSFLKNPLYVYVKIILLRQEGIFYLIVHDIRSFGILRENLSRMFSHF